MRRIETRQRISNRAISLRNRTFKNRVKSLPFGDWRQGNDQWYEINCWYVGFKPRVIKTVKLGRTEYHYTLDGENILHRDNGPAITYSNGFEQWFLYGVQLTPDDFDSIEMVKRMKAWAFLTPVQIAALCEKEKDKP